MFVHIPRESLLGQLNIWEKRVELARRYRLKTNRHLAVPGRVMLHFAVKQRVVLQASLRFYFLPFEKLPCKIKNQSNSLRAIINNLGVQYEFCVSFSRASHAEHTHHSGHSFDVYAHRPQEFIFGTQTSYFKRPRKLEN